MVTANLIAATNHFTAARHYEMIGERRKAAAEFRKSDKIMDALVTNYITGMKAARTKTA